MFMKNFVKNKLPLVSVIIPSRNEEKFIDRCLDSIIAQDYPKDKLEVLVVDGMSEDCTRKIVKEYERQFPFVNLVDNPKQITSAAFNTGIKSAKGEIIIIMGAHNTYEKDYISQSVDYLTNGNADNVGGVCKVVPQNNSLITKSIAYVFSSPFAAGNSYYRIGTDKPKYVDTVFGGCYKREIFDKIGFFDEDLLRTQDSELNARLIKSGGKVLLVPTIVSYYYTRKSLAELWKINLQYGHSKPLAVKKIGKVYTLRQLIPALFVSALIVPLLLSMFSKVFLWLFLFVLGSYTITNLGFSFKLSVEKGFKYFAILPLVFMTTHFAYGIGYLGGVWDFIIFERHKKKKIKDLPLTR